MLTIVLYVIAPLLLLAAAVVGLRRWLAYRADQRVVEEERKAVEQQAIKEAIEKQVLLPDGRPACIVCRSQVATETWPVPTTSWLDKVTLFKELYALVPRYEVRDGDGEHYENLVCPGHKRIAYQRWNEIIATKRMQVQRLITQIESEMAYLQGGGMLAMLREEHKRSGEMFGAMMQQQGGPVRLQLTEQATADHAPITMPPMSTRSPAEETPLDGMVVQGGEDEEA